VRYIPTAGISLQTSDITQRFLLKPTQVHTQFYAHVNCAVKVLVEKSSGLKLSDVEVDPPPAQGNSSILLDDV
jgi:hypothetical protein